MNSSRCLLVRWMDVLLLACLVALPLVATTAWAEDGKPEAEVKDARGLVARSLADCDNAEERAAMERMIFALFPEELRRVQTVFPRNRDEAEEIMDRVMDQCWELMELKERNPERYEAEMNLRQLNNQTAELARQATAATGAKREALVAQLKSKLEAYFDLKQEQMKRELAETKARLEELDSQVRRRAQGRDALLDRRLRQLLEGELEW